MEKLNNDILKIILNNVGHNICPMKFYNMRIVSKDFKNAIDGYKDGFYFYIKNYIGINNKSYNLLINNKLRINKPISIKFGWKILHLDDWFVSKDYKCKELPYPKYKEYNGNYIYERTLSNKPVVSRYSLNLPVELDYNIEKNILEKYYNIMMKYNIIFDNIKNDKVNKWILNN